MKIELFSRECNKTFGPWSGETRYGRIVLCREVLNEIFPSIRTKVQAILLISSLPKKGYVPFLISREYGFWNWRSSNLEEVVYILQYFSHGENVTTSILKSVKHCSESKLPKVVKIWVYIR